MRQLIAVIAAGIAGTWANAVAAEFAGAGAGLAFALVPGRYGVAIALCGLLPVLERLPNRIFIPISIALLAVGASLIAKLVFGAAAPWELVLSLNAVYAIFATLTYRLIVQRWGA